MRAAAGSRSMRLIGRVDDAGRRNSPAPAGDAAHRARLAFDDLTVEAVALQLGGDAGPDVARATTRGSVVDEPDDPTRPQHPGQGRTLAVRPARPEHVDVDRHRLV